MLGAKSASGSCAVIRASMAWPRRAHLILRQPQRLATRDPQHEMYEVEPRHFLGDGMLHLESRIHLEKVEFELLIDEELDRPGVVIAHAGGHPHRRLAHRPPHVVGEVCVGRLLDDLLVAQVLNRALGARQDR